MAFCEVKKNRGLWATVGLVGVTAFSGVMLSSDGVFANETVTKNASINVPDSCTMTGSGMSSHTGHIVNGVYTPNIGSTSINVVCNDQAGFSIYAVGFTGDEIGATNSTKLVGTSASSYATIDTGTATSAGSQDVSNWAMKLETDSQATYPISILSDTSGSYASYHAVPANYTKVATRLSATDVGTGATGSTLTTTYAVYTSGSQVPDTYTGQVKYSLVHPNNGGAPTPPTPPGPEPTSTCNTPVTGATYMQDINASNKATILAGMTQDAPYYLRDSRDQTPYCVSKLADGNVWMLDNLALDLTDSSVLNNVSASNTNATATSITSLKSGNRAAGNQYATAGLGNLTSGNSHSEPRANASYKDTVPSNSTLGAGGRKIGVYYNYCAASAGSYCYDIYTGTGNASQDLCPTNWRMPTGGDSGEFRTLYQNTNYNNYTKYKTALSLPISGLFFNGSPINQGDYGRWWSSTSIGSVYFLELDTNGVYPNSLVDRNLGYSLRCLLGV